MRKRLPTLADLLRDSRADHTALPPAQVAELLARWCVVFTPEVLQATGAPVYRKLRWHAFAYSFSQHVSADAARASYEAKQDRPLYVIDEFNRLGFRYNTPRPIDFSPCRLDLYILPENERWTMVFTHEHPGIGPFYRERPAPRSEHQTPASVS
jgi:hypothetical protein